MIEYERSQGPNSQAQGVGGGRVFRFEVWEVGGCSGEGVFRFEVWEVGGCSDGRIFLPIN